MPQVVTLRDMRCITGMGIIKGTSWCVPPLQDMHLRFGTAAPEPEAGRAGDGCAKDEAALEELLECLRTRDAAAKRAQAANEVRPREHTLELVAALPMTNLTSANGSRQHIRSSIFADLPSFVEKSLVCSVRHTEDCNRVTRVLAPNSIVVAYAGGRTCRG
jgi:hypothetical protein